MACLRRNAYLIKILKVELDWLDAEVSISNSRASYDYVFDRLDQLDRKLVSLLLAASPKFVDTVLFAGYCDEWRREVWSNFKHDGPFFQNGFYPLEPMIDPFWAIRTGILDKELNENIKRNWTMCLLKWWPYDEYSASRYSGAATRNSANGRSAARLVWTRITLYLSKNSIRNSRSIKA